MFNMIRKKWSREQKTFALLATLSVAALAGVGQMRHAALLAAANDADVKALRATTKALIFALGSNDQSLVHHLTTAGGYASIQQAKKAPALGSDAEVSRRLNAEWGNELRRVTYAHLDADHVRVSHTQKGSDGELVFQRGVLGWSVDRYTPQTQAAFQRSQRLHISQQIANLPIQEPVQPALF